MKSQSGSTRQAVYFSLYNHLRNTDFPVWYSTARNSGFRSGRENPKGGGQMAQFRDIRTARAGIRKIAGRNLRKFVAFAEGE